MSAFLLSSGGRISGMTTGFSGIPEAPDGPEGHPENRVNYLLSLKAFSILVISSLNFLSSFMRCSTWVQLWMTVEWSLPPTSFPIRAAGILVCFCARYIDTCRGMTSSRLRLLLLTAVADT